MADPELWYRYEDVQYAASPDVDGECRGSGELKVHLREFEVVSHTPHGVWIRMYFGPNSMVVGEKRFVLLKARKRYACPTIEEARESFIARKKRQITIHQSTVNRAKMAINLVNGGTQYDL